MQAPNWVVATETQAKWTNRLTGWTSTADAMDCISRATLASFYTREVMLGMHWVLGSSSSIFLAPASRHRLSVSATAGIMNWAAHALPHQTL